MLGSDQFPAPAAQTWRAVALALSHGIADLGAVKLGSIVAGAVVGIVLTVLAHVLPGRRHPSWAQEFTFPVASGWIAGESLMGVALVGWERGPALLRTLLGR